MKILIIQSAFIGDVVLATAMIESLKKSHPNCRIDFLLRKGNEQLLEGHPHIEQLLIFDKKNGKYRNLVRMLSSIRKKRYDYIFNAHRFASTGFLTAFSKAKNKVGFKKNPLSFFFSKRFNHELDKGLHEIERNHQLIGELSNEVCKPRLYPGEEDFNRIPNTDYVCMAPASVWFTKQYPEEHWISLIDKFEIDVSIYLLGGPSDKELCERIRNSSSHGKVYNMAGDLSFLESAAWISKAKMTFANDSAPMHFASAMNAPVTAIYCSTVPGFGFGPLSDVSIIAENKEKLKCRPCGLHGKKTCPEGHFKCSKIALDPKF